MKEISHCSLSDDVDAGVMSQEMADNIAKRMTDFQHRHPSPIANEKLKEESQQELDDWWALQQFAIIKHLGS